jgi:hypothetical protein
VVGDCYAKPVPWNDPNSGCNRLLVESKRVGSNGGLVSPTVTEKNEEFLDGQSGYELL